MHIPNRTHTTQAGVIYVTPRALSACLVLKFVSIPQPKPMNVFSPNFQGMFTPKGSRADYVWGGIR